MLTHTFGAVVLASFLTCAVTTVGIFAIRRYEEEKNNDIEHI